MGNHAQQPLHRFRLVCTCLAVIGAAVSGGAHAQAVRDYISIVGSSTVYPFATIVAEQFGRRNSNFKTPKVESTVQETAMLPDPLHPALVHFPIVLALLAPAIAAVLFWAIHTRRLPVRAWLAVILGTRRLPIA